MSRNDVLRAAMGQFALEGLSVAEIAELVELPPSRVEAYLASRGLQAAPEEEVEKACLCANCHDELRSVWIGERCQRTSVAGRVEGRPYCGDCIELARKRAARRAHK